MTARGRILAARASAVPTTILRHRRLGKPVPERGKDGEVVAMPEAEDFVLGLLKECRHDIKPYRKGDYLHVSDLLGKCVRKVALSDKFKVSMPASSVQTSMGLTFAQGTAIHDYVKSAFVKGHPDKLFGKWACLCETTVTEPMLAGNIPNIKCKDCGTVPSRYRELDIHNDELMVVGSPDVTLFLQKFSAYYPVEIKSMNPEDWKNLARPVPDHVLQVLFYWYLLKEAGYSVVDRISIIYVNKGYVFKLPYKEFVIVPEEQLGRLEEYKAEALSLKEYRTTGVLPPRTFCSSPSCKDAKECHVSNICFR